MENKELVTMGANYTNKTKFIMNALENGWRVEKKDNRYIFTKKHEGKKEIFMDDYLESFIKVNLGMK